jgi:sialate O-acetylesterase
MFKRPAQILGLTLTILFCARADVTLPRLLTDHMVLQRDRPIHIWGRAAESEDVSVTFQNETQATKADELGRWSVYLKPQTAGGPYELTVKGNNAITIVDILIGDVWFASGQSNMEFRLGQTDDAEREIAAATNPKIRFFHVEKKASYYPLEDVDSKGWQATTPETAPGFSAVGYFFARDLQKDSNIPIAVIDTSWGGTPLAAFTSMTAIGKDAALMPVFAQWAHMMENQSTTLHRIEKQDRALEAAIQQAKADGKPAPQRRWYAEPTSWAPAAIYNGMIAPVTPFGIRGAIWYQGESDATQERAPVYSRLFQTMITSWREVWGMGDFPFLYVQLPNFIAGPHNAWPELREAQLQTLALKNTGMAVALDQGTPRNIHPPHKLDVALRLALAARGIAYGETVEYLGPMYRQAVPENGQIRVLFDHAAGGLTAKGGELKGFEVAGADHKFSSAAARIEGGSAIVASSPEVPSPKYVRYAWTDNPDANLCNGKNLPASPFRSPE